MRLRAPGIAIALLSAALGGAAAQEPTPADSGRIRAARWNAPLLELADRSRLMVIPRGQTLLAQTSFDRGGGNDDGFSGRWSPLRREANGEHVLFDERGAGALTRLHFAFFDSIQPGQGREDYELRAYFEGESAPRIALPLKELVSGTRAPFLHPLAGDDRVSPGGPFVFYPLNFRRGLKITTTGAPNFFAFQGVRYRDAREASSHDPRFDDVSAAVARLSEAAQAPRARLGDQSLQIRGTAAPGQPLLLFEHAGGGVIERLVFELPPTLAQGLRLRATWEREATAALEAPLGFLFGNELGSGPVQAALFGFAPADAKGWIDLPMPFAQHARLELYAEQSVDLAVRIDWRPGAPPASFGHLRGELRENLAPRNGEDVNVLRATGRGRLAAVIASMGWRTSNAPPRGRLFLEGDERIYLDGRRSPALHGTGTEEFFDWGWYDTGVDRPFTLPLHGYPEWKLELLRDETACYRCFLHAPIAWEREVAIGLEHGPTNTESAEYRTLALFYAQSAPGIERSDLLEVGDLASETAHAWSDPSGVLLPPLGTEFEGAGTGAAHSDAGRRAVGSHGFRLALRSDNDGVRVRRLSDQALAPQQAEVYVDGAYVGTWYQARSNPLRRWLEDEFELPPAFTRGKSSIDVRLEPRGTRWNAYRYEAWSYLPVP
ncbi:MAG: DUF2961 domain-containing protein [Planctomycetes bacterium]|nr:DUF2961 domain-containing protein [Planctomycetota bacterium]